MAKNKKLKAGNNARLPKETVNKDGQLSGGGKMGKLIRSFPWSSTSLGDIDTWPQTLLTSVGIMLNSSYPMFIWWGKNELINFYNDPYTEILGDKHPEAVGKHAKETWGEIWNDIYPLVESVFTKGKPIFKKDLPLTINRFGHDEEAYFTFSYSPIFGDDSKPAGLFCVATETTEDVLSRQHLIESETRFRNLADTAPMYIAVADETGNAIYFNKPWLEFTGKSLKDMRGLDWLSTLHPDDATHFENDFKHAFEKRISIKQEYRFRRADGEYRWMLAIGAPRLTPNGHFIGYFGTYTDFHDLKIAQLALKSSEERFRAFINNLPNLAWIAKADGYIYWYNNRWYEYTGTEPNDMEGWGWQSVHHPEHLPGVLNKWKGSIKNGKTFEMVFPIKGSDQTFRPFLTRVVPLKSKDGKVLEWIGTNTDMTLQVKAKEAEAEKERLEITARQLAAQHQELVELNKTKDEFISLASHQLRTPATGVKQFLGMLIEGYGGELSSDQMELAQRSYDSNEREISIINDLLKVAQLDAGRMKMQRQMINFTEFIKEIIVEHRSDFAERHQTVVYKKPNKKIIAHADKQRLRMVLDNIIDNASKYTTENNKICITLSQDNNQTILIRIEDEGVGIPQADIEKIFDKFVRIDNPLSTAVGGSGLGLYLAKKIMDLHGGKITVNSSLHKGTSFSLSLPQSK